MKKRHVFVIVALLINTFLFAQKYNPLQKPNTYQNVDNPLYWKNRKPIEGYWQQDVHYKIKARLDEETDIVYGEEILKYTNNSPHELHHVFFHLYQQAFQPGSYADNQLKNVEYFRQYGSYEQQKLGCIIEFVKHDNKILKTEIDNTIIKVFLEKPLKSGETIEFNIKFKAYFEIDTEWRRMGVYKVQNFKHYNGGHWYPRIAVYDMKFGWATDQHFGKEFYGDFGTYDVELTLASNFIVEGTGFLTNRAEVLPDDLRKKLDILNFVNKPIGEAPSEIIPYEKGKVKTWIFHAENVHDFVWTADPTYRIDEKEWNGIKAIALVQEQNTANWTQAAKTAIDVIEMFSKKFGMYNYHKVIVADARQGMEYPMITLDSGSDPNHQLFAHEIGHQWFFGQVGSNETYRGFLDEGFTQFLTVWALQEFKNIGIETKNFNSDELKNKNFKEYTPRFEYVYERYLKKAIRNEEGTLNSHSDDFDSWPEYRVVYRKGATMLFNLQYVLGDSLFFESMNYYFEKWKFCHPYPEDFRKAIIEFTQVDLNWFFDEWLETSKIIDYAIKSVKRLKKNDNYIVKFKRIGEMQMPIDFSVIAKSDSTYNFHIPNTWFVKETDATVLPKWFGWRKIQPEYYAKITVPSGIKNIKIDPSLRLADINMLNNTKKFPIKYFWRTPYSNTDNWTKYMFYVSPDVWYNAIDGFRFGLNLHGDYMKYLHKVDFTIWYNSHLAIQKKLFDENLKYEKISYKLSYSTGLNKYLDQTTFNVNALYSEGLESYSISFIKKFNSKQKVYFLLKSMIREESQDIAYLIYPKDWGAGNYNNTVNFGFEINKKYKKSKLIYNFYFKTSALSSDYNFTFASFSTKYYKEIGKFDLSNRTFFQFGFGTNWAKESSLYLAGANPEQLTDNQFFRSVGYFAHDWYGFGDQTNHIHSGGGLNLRGYSGYFANYELSNGDIKQTYFGSTGASTSFELDFDKLIKSNSTIIRNFIKFDTYLFSDIGIINYNEPEEALKFADIRVDAGIGADLKFYSESSSAPLILRFDVPIFLNHPSYEDNDYITYRWLIGIGRAF
ncbi:MAG: M1 family metallopeptidase [Bacteroidetes bacterium]|jgi:hypothetical protein|nr:M1 family metallopeptidase [Bacteroidota bacterium]MBT6687289.1 M1 family metallopeptidase [Bacteroidota bacterium]MBT7143953.1 M1 family metallopeptidase [Bacteroidota bacterium]MBT7491134.1 M1 family metallopeptidase [Bacteroidota bacterium]